jgi:crotonobetainyl-CoA:carnitine CoA-transferase CaiB-like acyl-CoA transferase
LIRRQKKGVGALIEVSLLESLIDFQFELLTTYYSSNQLPQRSKHNNGHTLLSAPYGIYPTANGFIAIAMVPIEKLKDALECSSLEILSKKTHLEKEMRSKRSSISFCRRSRQITGQRSCKKVEYGRLKCWIGYK